MPGKNLPGSTQALRQAFSDKRIDRIVTGAGPLASAWSLALLAKLESSLWLICPDHQSAHRLKDDLKLLLPDTVELLSLSQESSSPYSAISPPLRPTARRQALLLELLQGRRPNIVISDGPGLIQRGMELTTLRQYGIQLEQGETIDREGLLRQLLHAGYMRNTRVEDPGNFALRGSLIDIFPPSRTAPLRLDLFGDEIESIHIFDPATQRNQEKIKAVQVAPLRDLLLDPEHCGYANKALPTLCDSQNYPSRKRRDLQQNIERGLPFFGMEALAPLFAMGLQPALWTRMLQLPFADNAQIVLIDGDALEQQMQAHWDKLHRDFARLRAKNQLAAEPEQHCAAPDAVFAELQKKACLEICSSSLNLRPDDKIAQETFAEAGCDCDRRIFFLGAQDNDALRQDLQRAAQGHDAPKQDEEDLFAPLRKQLGQLRQRGLTTLIAVHGQTGLQRLHNLLRDHNMNAKALDGLPDLHDEAALRPLFNPSLYALLCPVTRLPSAGVIFAQQGFALLSEADIFGRRDLSGATKKRRAFKTSLAELNDGDFVVHVEFGIGRYHGLVRLNLNGALSDFLLITYRDDDKLYLPVTRINQVQRYSGADGHRPRLDKLGGQSWSKTRARVKRAILSMAQELLSIYARRALSQAPVMAAPDALYREFEARFPFDETPDQAKAIEDCLRDLQRGQPMDRLVCGDVGYGKTEVALRASMLTVLSGYQGAVLTPTTVLAQQHFLTFSERFAGLPVELELLSRMRNNSQVKDSLQRLRKGRTDIVIGTHRLLSHDVDFAKLGLLIIDEEHRFGVKDKERVKAMRGNVHVLSMSATPIPRSLQMSFFSIRDLSVIDTAPAERVAIRTQVTRFDQDLIREVIERELQRGGQVYVVHNRVQSIDAFAAFVQRLVPNARLAVAHGQMRPAALEKIMLSFISGEKNVLVSTTIIESGIDIPRANTMIINRADRLGLAQLYQLRGRIGRSRERAYAYLLVPPGASKMPPKARKRLEVLQRFAELGAGFKIAQHDLELRGAGDILGKNQHGHVASVGYEMYVELLHSTVRDLQGKAPEDVPEPDLQAPVDAFIPDDYIFDVHERLQAYQGMATAQNSAEVYAVLTTLEERFGKPPAPLRRLAELMVIKVMLKKMAARGMSLHPPGDTAAEPARVIISLGERSRLDAQKLVAWVSEQAPRLRLTPQMKLVYTALPQDWGDAEQDLLQLARRLINEIFAVCK